jgi:hypothetical protein
MKWIAMGLGLFMAAMGAMKFAGDVPIFAIIEQNLKAQYGISAPFVDPWFKFATGVLEIAAAGLLVSGLHRLGGMLSAAIIGGAVLAHLTVLGIETPTSGAPGAETSPMLFIVACASLLIAVFVSVRSKR